MDGNRDVELGVCREPASLVAHRCGCTGVDDPLLGQIRGRIAVASVGHEEPDVVLGVVHGSDLRGECRVLVLILVLGGYWILRIKTWMLTVCAPRTAYTAALRYYTSITTTPTTPTTTLRPVGGLVSYCGPFVGP